MFTPKAVVSCKQTSVIGATIARQYFKSGQNGNTKSLDEKELFIPRVTKMTNINCKIFIYLVNL